MTLFFQQAMAGLSAGSIYAALAVALVLIYRSTRVVNFAQGHMGTFSAFTCFQLIVLGVPLWLALILAGIFSFILGSATFLLIIRPLMTRRPEAIVIACIGLFIGFPALCLWFWGSNAVRFPRIFPVGGVNMLGVQVSYNHVGALLTLTLLVLVLLAVFRLTRLGLAMRVAAAEPEKSKYVGIDTNRMLTFGWGLAAVFGFVAAVLAIPSLFLGPDMMLAVTIYGLAAATLGGWDSPIGAVVGGLVVGICESVIATFVPIIGPELRLLIPFLVISLILLFKPQGLFGTAKVARV